MVSLDDLLSIPRFSDLELLTSHGENMYRSIHSVEVTETPDIEYYIPANVLLLTTGLVFEDNQEEMIPFIDSLMRAKVIGLGIKTGRFLGEIDAKVIDYANENNFAIFHIPDNYSLGSLLHKFIDILWGKHEEEIDLALNIQRDFSDLYFQGASLFQILEEFSRTINSPTMILDPFGEIVVTSSHLNSKKIDLDELSQKICAKRQNSNKKIGYFQIKDDRGKIVQISLSTIPVHQYFPYYLIIFNPEKIEIPISKFVTEQAALVFSFILYKNEQIDKNNIQMVDEYIRNLLNLSKPKYIKLQDEKIASSHFIEQNSDYYQVIGFSDKAVFNNRTITKFSEEQLYLADLWLQKNINRYFSRAVIFSVDDLDQKYILIQEHVNNVEDKLREIAHQLNEKLGIELVFSVGGAVNRFSLLNKSYTQAKLIYDGRMLNNNVEEITYYKDGDISTLFSQLNIDEVNYYCENILKELAYPDTPALADMKNTLEVYLDNQCEITGTAKELFVHRNTVTYRIEKCEELLGFKVDTPENSFNLRMALKLLPNTN